MEMTQRKNKGDLEGFEEGSNYRLQFNIWKIETDWNLLKRNEANSILAPADNAIKTQQAKKAKEQCREAKKETILGKDKEGHVNDDIMSQDKCDPDVVEKNPKTLITHPATRDGTNGEQNAACDWEQSPDTDWGQLPTKGATTQPSNGRTQAAVWDEPQEQKEVHVNTGVAHLAWLEPRLSNLTVVDLVVVFLYHWNVIVFSLLLRERTEKQIQVEQLEQQLAEEKKKKECQKSR